MKLSLVLSVTFLFAVISQAVPIGLSKRREGQEQTPKAVTIFQEVKDLAKGSNLKDEAKNLSNAMKKALLKDAPTCDQQDKADEIIDLGNKFDDASIREKYVKVAKKYRKLERNTPGKGQPSKLCKKKPRHKELKGLKQAQDPTGKDKKPKKGKKKSKNVAETNPVGGVKMPKIKRKNGDFIVNGNGFNGDVNAAHNRQCDIQHNLCFNKFNSGDRSFSGADCDNQTNVCKQGPPVFA